MSATPTHLNRDVQYTFLVLLNRNCTSPISNICNHMLAQSTCAQQNAQRHNIYVPKKTHFSRRACRTRVDWRHVRQRTGDTWESHTLSLPMSWCQINSDISVCVRQTQSACGLLLCGIGVIVCCDAAPVERVECLGWILIRDTCLQFGLNSSGQSKFKRVIHESERKKHICECM